MSATDASRERPIRSFVRREGRMTPAQKRALAELWPRYGIDPGDGVLDLAAEFGRPAATWVEIGFGNGDTLAALAARYPGCNFLGIEVHRPGVGVLLQRLAAQESDNVRILCADARTVFEHHLDDASLAAVLVLFPDPWPKTRHHKRRLLQADFLALAAQRLAPGGRLHIASDWQDYAQQVLAFAGQEPRLHNTAGAGHYAERPDYRIATRFEQRGRQLDHGVWDVVLERA